MPIILKGISTAEDAILAYESGVQGIVLSNHGGRQLDTARSGIEILVEVIAALRLKGYHPDPKFEIYVDGGVRRASDVLKAIALGAKAVGVGRAFLYSFCAYGLEGVERAIQMFGDEFEMNMRLLGAQTIADLTPEMVDASALSQHIVTVPRDNLFEATCKPLLHFLGPKMLLINAHSRSTFDHHTDKPKQTVTKVLQVVSSRCRGSGRFLDSLVGLMYTITIAHSCIVSNATFPLWDTPRSRRHKLLK